MRFTITHRAGEHERFALTAFDSQIGKDTPVKTPRGAVPGRIVAATVTDDGTAVELTIEVPDGSPISDALAIPVPPHTRGTTVWPLREPIHLPAGQYVMKWTPGEDPTFTPMAPPEP
jgi:hypothetical protein